MNFLFKEKQYFPMFGRIPVLRGNIKDKQINKILSKGMIAFEYPDFHRYICKWEGRYIAIILTDRPLPWYAANKN